MWIEGKEYNLSTALIDSFRAIENELNHHLMMEQTHRDLSKRDPDYYRKIVKGLRKAQEDYHSFMMSIASLRVEQAHVVDVDQWGYCTQ